MSDNDNQWSAGNYNWESLFDELCRAHHLRWRQKWLLKNISKTLGVQPAVRLFLEPDWFVSASKTEGLQHRKRQLVELCKILFHRERSNSEKDSEELEERAIGSPQDTIPDGNFVGV